MDRPLQGRLVMSEHITPEKVNTFHKALEYARSNNYKDCLFVRGNIYLRKNNSTLPITINSEADLTKLREADFLDASRFPFEESFEIQLKDILDHVRLTQSEMGNIQRLLKDLSHALGSVWPDIQVFPFGSIITGLGIKTSDVDCYIQLPSEYSVQKPLILARNVLKKHNSTFTQVFAITRARVPILKFVHAPTGFNCDVNFSNKGGVTNSRLIGFLLRLDARALPLAIVLKYWSKVYNLSGTHLLPNYALTLMVIFYLQVQLVLPPVAALQHRAGAQWVGIWNTSFNDSVQYPLYNTESLYELLGGFFDYYKSFDFTQFVISPFLGRLVKKQQLRDLSDLPGAYILYKRNVLSKNCNIMNIDTPICIQDPFDHSRNCSAAVSWKLFNTIQGHVAIVDRMFNATSRRGFLRAMFSHKLVYEPMESTVPRKREPIRYGLELIKGPVHEYNVRDFQSGSSGIRNYMPEARYQHNNRSNAMRPGQPIGAGFVSHKFNQNINDEPPVQFILFCWIILICIIFWVQLTKDPAA